MSPWGSEDILRLAHGFVEETKEISGSQCSETETDMGGHQRGYAVKPAAGEEGLRSEVVGWSRISQVLIRKRSYFRN